MKQSIQSFTHEVFGQIRTITNDKGETFFVGNDVAKALGYANTQKAIRDHIDSEDKGVNEMVTPGGIQRATVINESGLYSLILSSKLPQARAFKRWVTSEVLPRIRMTGGYIPTHDAEGRELTDEEIVERGNEIIGRTLGLLNSCNKECLTATSVAALWGMDVVSFNNLLAGMGIQHRKGGRWQLAEELRDMKLAEERCFFCFSLMGKPRMRRYLVWTPAGVDFLDMVVRKLPRELKADVQLNIHF